MPGIEPPRPVKELAQSAGGPGREDVGATRTAQRNDAAGFGDKSGRFHGRSRGPLARAQRGIVTGRLNLPEWSGREESTHT